MKIINSKNNADNDKSFDLRGALLGEDFTNSKHDIDPRIISDFFSSLEDLCSALVESETFGYMTTYDGDVQPREFGDAHMLLGKIIWSLDKQAQYYAGKFSTGTEELKQIRDRAQNGQEIDLNKLANKTRWWKFCEAAQEFWDDMTSDAKASYVNVTGKPYKPYRAQGKSLGQKAGQEMVAALNEMLGDEPTKKKESEAA